MSLDLYRRGDTWWARVTVSGVEHRSSLRTSDERVAEKRAKVWREWLSEGWPDMSLDLDQQALDLINAWEAGEYLHPAQKKAALQVVVRDALAQARAEGLRQAAERTLRLAKAYREQDSAGTAMVLEDAAAAIRALMEKPDAN